MSDTETPSTSPTDASVEGRTEPPATDLWRPLLRLLRMTGPDQWIIVAVTVLSLAGVGFYVLVPMFLGRATDVVVAGALAGGVDTTELVRLLLIVLVLVVVASGLTLVQERLTAVIGESLAYRIRERCVDKLSRLPLSYVDGRPRGEVMSRISNDVDNVSETVQEMFAKVLTAVFTLVGVLVMMIWISPLLALVALVVIPCSLLVARLIAKRAQPYFGEMWAVTGKLNGHIEEMFTGHDLVRGFGRQREATEAFERHNRELVETGWKAQFCSGLIRPAVGFIGNVNYVLIAVIGGMRVVSGTLTIGDVQAFFHYSQQFGQPITQVASMAAMLQSGVASAVRIFELLDEEEEVPDVGEPISLSHVEGRVAFENVDFRYVPDEPLIEDLTLSAEPGQTIAIVGPTGAGKSTLVNLLMRFYEVDGGRITLDGVDIARMSRQGLRRHIGLVPQDPWLFEGTIAENIAYGIDGATREQVVTAATDTHVDHFVRTLPEGYDTVIDDEGDNLSSGERQLVTIARAFLARSPILVLDEASSLVDTRTELLVQRAMRSLREGSTCFVIAHRLSTIRDADMILVVESGRLVERGTHDRLLASDGAYTRMYADQFARSAAGGE